MLVNVFIPQISKSKESRGPVFKFIDHTSIDIACSITYRYKVGRQRYRGISSDIYHRAREKISL